VTDYPLTIRHASGRTTDVLYNATVYRNEAGGVQGVFAAARDITERKRAEEELARHREHLEELVAQRTRDLEAANRQLEEEIGERKRAAETLARTAGELARSNQELEQFAYVASHDLQEPLRVVTGYVQLLERRYKGKFDADAEQFIHYVVDGVARMQQLIRDLLDYSRVGTRGKAMEPTDAEGVLGRVLVNLGKIIAESRAVVTHDPLPTVRADETQLLQLFQNLIGNAIKFRSERRPEIHVSARPAGSGFQFSVRDNGIGIEKQYREQVFEIFQRLHTRQKYPGTGIGLAICKRIVERHGGRIWLESEPGQGTTFHFTIG
jgi:light-regulated signal transduction histidine kinase (bacteriophytochrome)